MLASTALSHLTVLDLTRVRAGPTACASSPTGARTCIKIEMPAAHRRRRRHRRPARGLDFQNLHRNKRGMTLNLKSPEGVAILKKLVAKADVVVENFRPDVKDRLGIDYEALAAVNPRLDLRQHLGLRRGRARTRMRPGFDQIAQGMGGLMSITGLPGQGPVRVGIPIADLCAGIFCALRHHGGAARAREVRQGPVGRNVAAAGADLHARLPGGALADARRGAEAGRQQPSDLDPDRRLQDRATATSTSRRPGTRSGSACARRSARPSCATPSRLRDRRAALEEPRRSCTRELEQHFVKRDTADWVETLNEAGVPCGPIYSIDQAFADPQVKHLGIVAEASSDVAVPRPAGDAVAHAEPRRRATRRRRASTPTRSCASSATSDAEIERSEEPGNRLRRPRECPATRCSRARTAASAG